MLRVLIVDDEVIVRTSLSGMVDWEALGFCIVGTAANGKSALNIMQSEHVDVLFTDIKMPIMDGIELLTKMQDLQHPPLAVVLSAYDEYELVRRAFRLGAHDYILKNDITPAYVTDMLASIRKAAGPGTAGNKSAETQPQRETLRRMALGDMAQASSLLAGEWCLGCMEIDNFKTQSLRFGSQLETSLIQPMLELAGQIPRIATKCVITPVSFSRFILLFCGAETVGQAGSICRQLKKVWQDYINLQCTGGISKTGTGVQDFQPLLQECYSNITLKFIFGPGGVYTPAEEELFNIKKAAATQQKLRPLLEGMGSMKAQELINTQQTIFSSMLKGTLEEAKQLALETVYLIQMQLIDSGTDVWDVFNTEQQMDFYQQVCGLDTIRDVELWVTGIIRWVTRYLESTQVSSEMDIMDKARHFISDNYTNPELNLAAVAGYIGLNEKYFSTRFNKEVGKSFVGYLVELRIARAKQLILKTDMRMYEVSDAVGFTSVEHFTRVFKKHTGVSPKSYHGEK